MEVLKVDQNRREAISNSILNVVGPRDGTVVVSVEDSGEGGHSFSEHFVDDLIKHLGSIGTIVVVRYALVIRALM